MSITFPNETLEYRAARDALLKNELALRRQMEAVAAELRALPRGGEVPEDYAFEEISSDGELAVVWMSELFRGGDTLMVYHYMFPRTRATSARVPLAAHSPNDHSMRGSAHPVQP